MSDITITLYKDDIANNNEEHELFMQATTQREFKLLGNLYVVTDIKMESFSRSPLTMMFLTHQNRDRTIIKARKLFKASLPVRVDGRE